MAFVKNVSSQPCPLGSSHNCSCSTFNGQKLSAVIMVHYHYIIKMFFLTWFVCYWICIIQIHFDLKFQSAANFSANNLLYALCLYCMTSLDHFENTPKYIHCFGTFWNINNQQILGDIYQKTLNNSSLHCLLWHT